MSTPDEVTYVYWIIMKKISQWKYTQWFKQFQGDYQSVFTKYCRRLWINYSYYRLTDGCRKQRFFLSGPCSAHKSHPSKQTEKRQARYSNYRWTAADKFLPRRLSLSQSNATLSRFAPAMASIVSALGKDKLYKEEWLKLFRKHQL